EHSHKKRSAAVSWILSVVCPGAGQIYCGNVTLGSWTLGLFFLASLVVVFTTPSQRPPYVWGTALRFAICLWVFATLDAYFTAKEITESKAQDSRNPRVAALLNLVTKGFGYFYLGEREKGIIIFVILTGLNGLLFSNFENAVIRKSISVI